MLVIEMTFAIIDECPAPPFGRNILIRAYPSTNTARGISIYHSEMLASVLAIGLIKMISFVFFTKGSTMRKNSTQAIVTGKIMPLLLIRNAIINMMPR